MEKVKTMKNLDYVEIFKRSKDVNDFYQIIKDTGCKSSVATIKRNFYRVRINLRKAEQWKGTTVFKEVKKQETKEHIPEKAEEAKFSDYCSTHTKRLKLEDFKRMKIPLTDKLLLDEGFSYAEVNKILGKTELKKVESFYEEEII